jgi:hypothetical protein
MILETESQMTPVKKGRNQKGEFNNHYGHKMTQQSRNAISQSQKRRYSLLRQALDQAANDDRIRRVVQEEITKFLSENAIQVNNNKPTNNIPLT